MKKSFIIILLLSLFSFTVLISANPINSLCVGEFPCSIVNCKDKECCEYEDFLGRCSWNEGLQKCEGMGTCNMLYPDECTTDPFLKDYCFLKSENYLSCSDISYETLCKGTDHIFSKRGLYKTLKNLIIIASLDCRWDEETSTCQDIIFETPISANPIDSLCVGEFPCSHLNCEDRECCEDEDFLGRCFWNEELQKCEGMATCNALFPNECTTDPFLKDYCFLKNKDDLSCSDIGFERLCECTNHNNFICFSLNCRWNKETSTCQDIIFETPISRPVSSNPINSLCVGEFPCDYFNCQDKKCCEDEDFLGRCSWNERLQKCEGMATCNMASPHECTKDSSLKDYCSLKSKKNLLCSDIGFEILCEGTDPILTNTGYKELIASLDCRWNKETLTCENYNNNLKVECRSDQCKLNEICYNIGYRQGREYCSYEGFLQQKKGEEYCDNNFECQSNLCIDEKCINSGFFQRLINWLKKLLN